MFMKMSNNIHKININIPIVTFNFSQIRFPGTQTSSNCHVFSYFSLNLFICVITHLL